MRSGSFFRNCWTSSSTTRVSGSSLRWSRRARRTVEDRSATVISGGCGKSAFRRSDRSRGLAAMAGFSASTAWWKAVESTKLRMEVSNRSPRRVRTASRMPSSASQNATRAARKSSGRPTDCNTMPRVASLGSSDPLPSEPPAACKPPWRSPAICRERSSARSSAEGSGNSELGLAPL